jgi:excinuclease ABC subunit A
MDESIIIHGAREHNLQNIDLTIPRNQLVVITGLSGSGKSSLAFDTIYAEGQRRYMESLSAYARQFLGMMERPDVDFIDGLSPVIAIDQKTVGRNPRSTVGTVTEIYDFLRLLFARAADAYSYLSGAPMRKQSDDEIIDSICDLPEGSKLYLLAPVVRSRKGHYRELFEQIAKQGYSQVRVDGRVLEIERGMQVDRYKVHDIEVVVDRLLVKGTNEEETRSKFRSRVSQSVGVALEMGNGTLIAAIIADATLGIKPQDRILSRNLTNPEDDLSYDDPSPNSFSFNTPYGACPTCNGMGAKLELDELLLIPDATKSIGEGGVEALGKPRDMWLFAVLKAVAKKYGFNFDTPLNALTAKQMQVLLDGTGEEKFTVAYAHKDREPNSDMGRIFYANAELPRMQRRKAQKRKSGLSSWIEKYPRIGADGFAEPPPFPIRCSFSRQQSPDRQTNLEGNSGSARFFAQCGTKLPQPQPRISLSFGRRKPAHPIGNPDWDATRRRVVCPRRAFDWSPSSR